MRQGFNHSVDTNGSVGIWHETSAWSPRSCEKANTNMRPFGFGRAGVLPPAVGGRQAATARLAIGKHTAYAAWKKRSAGNV